jgi:hypothetical protein
MTTFSDCMGFMVFNTIFNNISIISWLSVLLVEETRLFGENHRPAAIHCKLYHIILYRWLHGWIHLPYDLIHIFVFVPVTIIWIFKVICRAHFLCSMIWDEKWLFVLLILVELLTITFYTFFSQSRIIMIVLITKLTRCLLHHLRTKMVVTHFITYSCIECTFLR